MLSSELQDPDYKLRHAGELRAPELPMKRSPIHVRGDRGALCAGATTRRKRRGRIARTAIEVLARY